jgi:hypothetical protein
MVLADGKREVSEKRVLFGDLHVHTGWSLDAFAFGVVATPDEAFRFARGEPIRHALGYEIALREPLDFIAVTDHAEYLGVFAAMADAAHPLSKSDMAGDLYDGDRARAENALARIRDHVYRGIPMEQFLETPIVENMWRRSVQAAEEANQPGVFTSFIAFEWSATPDGANLHRNVIFAGGVQEVPRRPFSAIDSQSPQALWAYLDRVRNQYGDVLAIPHNSNLSDGRMFGEYPQGVAALASMASQRMRNEPVVEITQIKGTSETHPSLSPGDDWAAFEILEELMGSVRRRGKLEGSYVRDALKLGLRLQQTSGVNPFEFGMVGASDSHNASSPTEEDNYSGKIGRGDGDAESRLAGSSIHSKNLLYSAAGLTGVWAESNTRSSIFRALRRGETFATSGPRIHLHFKSARSSEGLADTPTPMGSRLPPGRVAETLHFLASASRDPTGSPLQRMQVVKGWLDEGELRERVFDVACGSGELPDIRTFRCPGEDAFVDLKTCNPDPGAGSSLLRTRWTDPEFDHRQPAFYYLRVLEHPSCRWSTWDALKNGWEPPPGVPVTIQERAWSSPIWYYPTARD